MLVFLLKIILIRQRLDFVKIKTSKFQIFKKNMGVLLKIADVIDDTFRKYHRSKKRGKAKLSSIKLKFSSFLVSAVQLPSGSNTHALVNPHTQGSSFIVMK